MKLSSFIQHKLLIVNIAYITIFKMSNEQYKVKANLSSFLSLCLGIVSVFLWEISIIPILAIVLGIIGLIRDKKKLVAGIGLALGIIFIIVRFTHGYIDRGFLNTPLTDNALQESTMPTISNPEYLKIPPLT